MNNLLMFPFHFADGGQAIIMAATYQDALGQILMQMPNGRTTEIFPIAQCQIEWHDVMMNQLEEQKQSQQKTIKELRYV